MIAPIVQLRAACYLSFAEQGNVERIARYEKDRTKETVLIRLYRRRKKQTQNAEENRGQNLEYFVKRTDIFK